MRGDKATFIRRLSMALAASAIGVLAHAQTVRIGAIYSISKR